LPVVVTFDRHPASVVAPSRTPPLIYSLNQRLRVLGTIGVDAVWLIQFDENFSRQSGEAFVRALTRDCPAVRSVCVGSAFTFGCQRSGNVELLQSLGEDLGFAVHGLAAVALDGHRVSSTRVREAIRTGDLDAAHQMLGREYSLCGAVVEGDRLGQKLGFPTANLDTTGLVLPPGGVYAIHANWKGVHYRGVLNLGHRPTLACPQPQLRVEAHLLDFDHDLYGQELEITFAGKLRDEQRFPSLDALREQIAQDIRAARRLFSGTAGKH
jgi:riboflavin kinase / FMN adenylyltransferase